ncbi:alpha-2,8-sialyltransferase 8F isoform X2 [Sceloporus undulatus]|uniref:alpha-2,8-sialyltransferase 8F isoform X2 n=1 Tax=Sceloporus undulatus TaxID=8520 RepID=UPI001C4B0284|nr:alpha-2,8-sialyltransferase 8F isoform X2 [Sceloporus undulatus]
MRAALALGSLLGSLLLCLCLAWLSGDGSPGGRAPEQEQEQERERQESPFPPKEDRPPGLRMRSLRSPPDALQQPLPPEWLSLGRYSEDYYLQIVGKLQNCTWKKRPQEYTKFRSELTSCCDAAHNFIASQNNTPLGSNMSYEVDNKKTIHISEEIFRMLPESQPLDYPFKQCAVVGNGGILKGSNCGAEIDKSDFVFRCNLPPTEGSVSQDVGNKTNLVTVNPSIIAQKYNKLNEKKATFLENIARYGEAFLLLPAFSFRSNTATSFKVHHTLREFSAKQKAIFFYPKYLKNLAQYWRTKGVKAYRLSSGFMITSAAVELCENVKLYGFWPFSKSIAGTSISHHYYDNQLPKPGFHAMPKEYNQILQLHGKGILKLQFGKCHTE